MGPGRSILQYKKRMKRVRKPSKVNENLSVDLYTFWIRPHESRDGEKIENWQLAGMLLRI